MLTSLPTLIPLANVDAKEAASLFHGFAEAWERDRLRSFVRHCDRERYAHAHGAMRVALAHAVDRSIHELTFYKSDTGKPHLRGGPAFSLSYVGGDAWLVMGRFEAIGLDVVDLSREEEELDDLIAPETEKQAVRRINPWLLRADVVVWAAKEAAAKLADRVEIAPEDWCLRLTHCLEVSANDVPTVRVEVMRVAETLAAAVARPLRPGDAAMFDTQTAS